MFSKNKKTLKRVLVILMCAAIMLVALTGCFPATTGTDGTTGDGTGTTDGTADGAGGGGGGGLGLGMMFAYLAVIVLVFYFLMIRPEKKRKKKTEEMRNSLAIGDNITTIGGMVGKIVNISGDFVTFETGEDRVRIKIAKWGISSTGKDTQEPDDKAGGAA